MLTVHVTKLASGTSAPLLATLDRGDGVSRWMRVGSIARGETHLRVDFDASAMCLYPVWIACVNNTRDPRFARIRFGVFTGRGGVAIVAVSACAGRG